MLLQLYTYVKPRSAFGKQCLFGSSGPVAVEDVLPETRYLQRYIFRHCVQQRIQNCTQFAAHDVQTIKVPTKNTSMLHVEGGWAKEINPRDAEVVQRFRRRVEKEDGWHPHMMNLMAIAENCVLQNNAINIYQEYFDDMIPAHLVRNYDVRTKSVFDDPQVRPRPITHLSWAPGSNRIAASYAFSEMEADPFEPPANLVSYIWDMANPNKPFLSLKPESAVMAIEFNPRDPSMLVSGLMTGQVCHWDLRIGDQPVQTSLKLHSHRFPTNQVAWTSSKCNYEFFSSSPDGMIKWWDVRNLLTPTETLVMDLDQPTRGDVFRAVGVTAIHFEPAMGSRFLAGLQNGMAISVNRKAQSVTEKIALKYDGHLGPVVAVERNPINLTNFLTIGDWCAKIWADDTKEGCLLSTCRLRGDVSGGCWSRSRYSVFFTINTNGVLEVHDILAAEQAPLITFPVCQEGLTAIAPHENGRLLAVGSRGGGIYLVECTEALTSNSRADKLALSSFLERQSHFEKLVDNRLKEVRLTAPRHSEDVEPAIKPPLLHPKEKKDKEPRKSKDTEKAKPRESDKLKAKDLAPSKSREKSEVLKKRHKSRKTTKAISPYGEDYELSEMEAMFFKTVVEESEKYEKFGDSEERLALQWVEERSGKKEEDEAKEKESSKKGAEKKKKERAPAKAKSKRRMRSKSVERRRRVASDDELVADIEDEPQTKKKKVKRRKHLDTCPMKLCDPAICCMDIEGDFKIITGKKEEKPVDTKERKQPSKVRPFFIKEKWFRRLSEFIKSIPERSPAHKRQVTLAKDAPPTTFLREEVERAKKHLVFWQRKLARGKRSSWIKEERPSRRLNRIYDKGSLFESKSEETVREVESVVEVIPPPETKKKRKRKGKKSSAFSAQQELEEVEKKPELDWTVAQKIDEIRKKDIQGDDVVYPRISAAFQAPMEPQSGPTVQNAPPTP